MEDNLSIYYIKKLMDIIRDIDRKSTDITAVIDENGLDDTKDYSDNYAEIGKRLVELHGLDDTYFSDEITRLIKIVFNVIDYDNQYDVTEDEIYDLCFRHDDNEYIKAKKIFFDKLSGKKKRFEDSLVDFSLDVFDNDSEIPLFYNTIASNWLIHNENLASYQLVNNREQLHGIIIPQNLYKFFDIADNDLLSHPESYDDAKKIMMLFKKKIYKMAIYISEGNIFLVWLSDFRKRILRKYPDSFSFTDNEASNSHVSIYFNRTFLEENKFYNIDFESK